MNTENTENAGDAEGTQESRPIAISSSVLCCSRRWKTVLLLSMIFLCGAVVGGGIVISLGLSAGGGNRRRRPRTPQAVCERFTERITRQLKLDQAKSDELRIVLLPHATKLFEVRKEMWAKFRPQLAIMRSDIAAILDDAQKQNWKKMCEQFDKRRAAAAGGKPKSIPTTPADKPAAAQ